MQGLWLNNQDNNMTISLEKLPLLRAAARSPSRFEVAVERVLAGVEAGSIRNVDYQDVKYEVGQAAADAWNNHVASPFFHGGKWERLPLDVNELYDSIMILSLHDVISTAKKVARSKATGPAVDAMRAVCAEALPLAEAVASLKGKVVKGRAPSAGPSKPVNPNKVVKTCPVCFRAIAVVGGTMAHHGYTRPDMGWQTASCQGIRFKPLEVSSEGLQWLIAALRERLEARKQAYAKRATHPEFLMTREGRNSAAVKIMRADPLWPQLFARHVAELRSEIAAIEHDLPRLDKMLADWKPEAER